nr:RNA-directed DNA polymerase, eukaryota [Tanacetum cinerariifolium]
MVWLRLSCDVSKIFPYLGAYDSVGWDYLLNVLHAFGFGPNWCMWIRGEWSDSNMKSIVTILKCFFLVSGLKINIQKIQVLGIGVPRTLVTQAASLIGCALMQRTFRYLGVMIGRLTLLKSVLGASPLYNMSIYKVPKGALNEVEAICSKFFNDADSLERKITWVSWDKFLAPKKIGGLGVSSFHALNRALLLKWVCRFISQDGSLWYRIIQALYGHSFELHVAGYSSLRSSILREMHVLKSKGFDFVSHCTKRVGDGHNSRWIYDLSGDGEFRVKVARTKLDDVFLPSDSIDTRWVKYIPIKINVFAWRVRLDRLPTRVNLFRRGVVLESSQCPMCGLLPEDIHHVIFRCDIAQAIFRWICRWWELDWHDLFSFSDWYAWFSAIRLSASLKLLLEGVFYTTWWHLWAYRNQTIFAENSPRRSVIFDDIVSRSFFWCSSRCNRVFSWETWIKILI